MSIPIDHLIRSRRRSITLIVRPDGRLEVRAPIDLSDARVHGFVASHERWIREQQAQALRNPPPPARKYSDGEEFRFLGQLYPLQLVPPQRPALSFDGRYFCLSRNIQPKGSETFTRWYRTQAAALIPPRVQALAALHGFRYQKIRISSARTRWGSCSTRGTLSFSWRLVLAPQEMIDYVIIHELVHTRVHGHTQTFWSQVETLMPETRKCRKWLLENGKFLTLD